MKYEEKNLWGKASALCGMVSPTKHLGLFLGPNHTLNAQYWLLFNLNAVCDGVLNTEYLVLNTVLHTVQCSASQVEFGAVWLALTVARDPFTGG